MALFKKSKKKLKELAKALNVITADFSECPEFDLSPQEIKDTIATGKNDSVQDLYDKLQKVDSHFVGKMQDRLSIAKEATFNWQPASESPRDQEILEFCQENIKRAVNSDIIEHLLKAVFFRVAGCEINWKVENSKIIIESIETLPFRAFENNKLCGDSILEEGRLRPLLYQRETGKYFEIPQFKVIYTTTPIIQDTQYVSVTDTVSLIMLAKYYAILKQWTKFLERYGNPPVLAHTKNLSVKALDELLEQLEDFSANAYGVIQNVDELTILEPKSTGSQQFLPIIELCDSYISIATTGQAATSGDGSKSSYASSKVLERVAKRVIYSTFNTIEYAIKKFLIEPLVFLNYADAIPPTFTVSPPADLEVQAKLDKELFALGVRFKKTYFVRNYHLIETEFDLMEEKETDLAELDEYKEKKLNKLNEDKDTDNEDKDK